MDNLIFTIIGVVFLIIGLFLSIKTHKINKQVARYNAKLNHKKIELNEQVEQLEKQHSNITKEIKNKTQEIADLYKKAEETAIIENKIQERAYNNYISTLENAYQKADNDFDNHMEKLNQQMTDKKNLLEADLAKTQDELDQIKATRAAARQALQKEQEVKENKDNYRLTPTQGELDDIHRLELVKKELHKPRILSMLIWQSFWLPLVKVKFPQILQDKTKMGIYKITNIKTDECYIGQSTDIDKRWRDHIKCGLGIDTPVGNKLYKAMQEYGIENFTFELLTECPREELNEKEKYFISLYEADTFGYNSKEI